MEGISYIYMYAHSKRNLQVGKDGFRFRSRPMVRKTDRQTAKVDGARREFG